MDARNDHERGQKFYLLVSLPDSPSRCGEGKGLTPEAIHVEASRPAVRPVPLSWLWGKDNSTGEASLVLGHDVRIPADTAKGVKTSPFKGAQRHSSESRHVHSLCALRAMRLARLPMKSLQNVQHVYSMEGIERFRV